LAARLVDALEASAPTLSVSSECSFKHIKGFGMQSSSTEARLLTFKYLAQRGAGIAGVGEATFAASLHLSEVVLGAPVFLQQRPFARREDAILALELGIVVELLLDFRQLDMLALRVVWLLHQPLGR